jgi:pimeloyl-ACP methyl ester carboxylesterase
MKLHYRKTGGPNVGKTPIVFLHGAGGSSTLFGNQFQAFRELATCYFLDLPGHGGSLHPIEEPSIEMYAEEVVHFIDYLPAPAVLIGHSMGGTVALSVALSNPDLIERLILAGTGCRLAVSEKILTGLETDYEATVEKILRYCFSRSVDPELFARARDEVRRVDPHILRADFHACNVFDGCNRLSEIKIPTLIICGDSDVMTPLALSQQLQTSISGARLQVVPGGSHMLMLESPAEFNTIIRDRLLESGSS